MSPQYYGVQQGKITEFKMPGYRCSVSNQDDNTLICRNPACWELTGKNELGENIMLLLCEFHANAVGVKRAKKHG
jgi:hypothetical protein